MRLATTATLGLSNTEGTSGAWLGSAPGAMTTDGANACLIDANPSDAHRTGTSGALIGVGMIQLAL